MFYTRILLHRTTFRPNPMCLVAHYKKNGAKIEVHNQFYPRIHKFIEDKGQNRINKKTTRWVTLNSTPT